MIIKTVVFTILLLALPFTFADAETLADLLWQFKERAGESQDSTEACLRDTSMMVMLDQAQARVVALGGLLPKRVDFTYSRDSVKYKMPTDYRHHRYVIVRHIGKWWNCKMNPGFESDSAFDFQWFIDWEHENQPELYVKGSSFSVGDTIRVFYFGIAPQMVQRTDSCYAPDDMHGLIIEEALSYMEWAKTFKNGYQVMNQTVRQDMGIPQRKPQK
jgi:hypothetical protein